MKKEYRVRKSDEFNQIIKLKHSVVNREFVVYYRKNDSHLRVGLSVSKKLGNAVVRNKTKRQVRMMVNHLCNKNDQHDYIIIVRNHYLNQSFKQNEDSLLSLFNKISKRS